MSKIIIVDGGPRRNMNTAAMLDAFAEGISESGKRIEVKRVRLYELTSYRGCISCLACKLKGRPSNVCLARDGLKDVFEDISDADGLAIGSPIYMGQNTGQTQCFLERLVFPWLSYNDYSLTVPKRMPVVFIYTMNATEDFLPMMLPSLELTEGLVGKGLGSTERIIAFNTVQVKDTSRYDMAAHDASDKERYRAEHWEDDLRKAREAGRRMADGIKGS